MHVMNLDHCFQRFSDHWNPRIVAKLNGQELKLAKLKGTFVWHEHPHEDELFLVVRGMLRIQLEDRELVLRPGEFTVIPKGTRHLPIADDEVEVILLEPAGTNSTGGVSDFRSTEGSWLEGLVSP